MKVITIKQPWASLIVHGIKDIENRTWKTNFRGRILVHAGVQRDNSAKLMLEDEEYELLGGVTNYCDAMLGVKSSIIGSVEIVDCVRNHRSEWAEKEAWNWVLANPILFEEPITEVKGCLGLWNYEMDTENNVGMEMQKVKICDSF